MRLIIFLLLICGGILVFTAVDSEWRAYEASQEANIEWETIPVLTQPFKLTVPGNIQIQAANPIQIQAPTEGKIEEVSVEEGDTVKESQVLALFSSKEREEALEAAKAQGIEALQKWMESNPPIEIKGFKGVVTSIRTFASNQVAKDDVLFQMAEDFNVIASVAAEDLKLLRAGTKTEIRLDDIPDLVIPGEIAAPEGQKAKLSDFALDEGGSLSTVKLPSNLGIKINTPSLPRNVTPNMKGKIDFIIVEKKDAKVIPTWLAKGKEQSRVRLLMESSAGKPQVKTVFVGRSNGQYVEVLTELKDATNFLFRDDIESATTEKSSLGEKLLNFLQTSWELIKFSWERHFAIYDGPVEFYEEQKARFQSAWQDLKSGTFQLDIYDDEEELNLAENKPSRSKKKSKLSDSTESKTPPVEIRGKQIAAENELDDLDRRLDNKSENSIAKTEDDVDFDFGEDNIDVLGADSVADSKSNENQPKHEAKLSKLTSNDEFANESQTDENLTRPRRETKRAERKRVRREESQAAINNLETGLSKTGELATSAFEKTKVLARDGASAVGTGLKKLNKVAGEAFKSAKSFVSEKVGGEEGIKDRAKAVSKNAKAAVSDVGGKVGELAEKTGEAAKSGAKKGIDLIRKGAKNGKEMLGEGVDKVKEVFGSSANKKVDDTGKKKAEKNDDLSMTAAPESELNNSENVDNVDFYDQ